MLKTNEIHSKIKSYVTLYNITFPTYHISHKSVRSPTIQFTSYVRNKIRRHKFVDTNSYTFVDISLSLCITYEALHSFYNKTPLIIILLSTGYEPRPAKTNLLSINFPSAILSLSLPSLPYYTILFFLLLPSHFPIWQPQQPQQPHLH